MRGRALIHYLLYRLGLEKPETQTTAKERAAIKKYANQKEVAVEIGVFEGVNTVELAKALAPNGKLYGIDPFFKGSSGVSYHKLIATSMLNRAGIKSKVVLLEKFSYEAVDDIEGSIDLIFIDGDHSYEGIQRDWNDWFPKIKEGGVILLHDTQIPTHDPNVAQLGSYLFFQDQLKDHPHVEIIEIVDSLSILLKTTLV